MNNGIATDPVDKISNFVESMRMESDRNDGATPGTSNEVQPDERYLGAQKRAERTILEAEKYKAIIAEPPGEMVIAQNVVRNVGSGLSDDDFFHLTCHVESGLLEKIEKGQFVELDKLIPKDKRRLKSEDNHMEWIQSEGGTFLAPVSDRLSKINSFRCWEQAFRVYATIFCSANPHRSKEIWQYVSVISTVSNSYIWENVYEYDVTFRHLMAFNPSRSWAVTYNQMWNLCMKDHIVRTGFQNNFNRNSIGGNTPRGNFDRRKKGKHCWYFNRGEVCKYGKKCRFIEPCSYCDSAAHGVNICPKAEAKPKPGGPSGSASTD